MNSVSNQNQTSRAKALAPALLIITALLALAGAALVRADLAANTLKTPRVAPPNSTAYGKTLAQWQELYWRWLNGQVTIAPDANGNAVVGNVVLLAFPPTPGDGTPGHLDLTLNAGQPFVLPLWNILGNSYADGSADPFIDLIVFRTLDLTFMLDGVTIIDSSNLMLFYTQFDFVPPIPDNVPPATAFIFLQGIGMVHAPLTPGSHTLKLDARNTDTVDFFGLSFEFHNTWNVTVQP